jgi:hypothetical protein
MNYQNDIKHVCSLGISCTTGEVLKRNNIKKCSYPFDWLQFNLDHILNCIKDDFKTFLDKTYYECKKPGQSYHKYYNTNHDLNECNIFLHHDLLNNIQDYEYVNRCVIRFRQLLNNLEHKLFIIAFPFQSLNNVNENKENVKIFNNEFKKYVKNYTLLNIIQIGNCKEHFHKCDEYENIKFIEIHTVLHTIGNTVPKYEETYKDYKYFDNILNDLFDFSKLNN